jgi:membrane protease YdiL (CAAX protease family)
LIRWAERRPKPVIVLISGAVFALPHIGNPEAQGHELAALAAWFVLGAGWAYVSVRDRGIELALGAHLANNLFAILFVAYDNAALPTSAVVTTPELNIDGTAIAIAVLMSLFIVLTRPRT